MSPSIHFSVNIGKFGFQYFFEVRNKLRSGSDIPLNLLKFHILKFGMIRRETRLKEKKKLKKKNKQNLALLQEAIVVAAILFLSCCAFARCVRSLAI